MVAIYSKTSSKNELNWRADKASPSTIQLQTRQFNAKVWPNFALSYIRFQ